MPSFANTASGTPITLQGLPKAVVHIDCDAFFASVEQSLDPALRGRPVITGRERGIAASMSYEAKRRGVTRGMRLFEVKKVCPDAVILPNDYETYSLVSKRLFGIIRRFTPDVEEYSIDEAFAELSGLRRVYRGSYEDIARQIKEAVERELGITVSVGLSSTKSLAKICSKENKPAGFTCVKGYELHTFLKKIPTERVCGFGPSSTALLAKHGMLTVYDFVMRPEGLARKLLGKVGAELWHELRGESVYPVMNGLAPAPASISKFKTFTPPSNDRAFVRAQLLRNVESAFIKLRRHGLRAERLGVHLLTHDFKGSGAEARLSRPTASTLDVIAFAGELFDGCFDERLRYRRSGVWLTHLSPEREAQPDLFEDPCRIASRNRLSRVMDEIGALYGKHTLHVAATDALRIFARHLGERGDLARRKRTLLKGETFRQRLGMPLWDVKI